MLDQGDVLTCALGGLSKSGGLPQVKLGWMAWAGPRRALTEAMHAYEIIADSYLSVSTPVQVAAPALLAGAGDIRARIGCAGASQPAGAPPGLRGPSVRLDV